MSYVEEGLLPTGLNEQKYILPLSLFNKIHTAVAAAPSNDSKPIMVLLLNILFHYVFPLPYICTALYYCLSPLLDGDRKRIFIIQEDSYTHEQILMYIYTKTEQAWKMSKVFGKWVFLE